MHKKQTFKINALDQSRMNVTARQSANPFPQSVLDQESNLEQDNNQDKIGAK